jgi:hypothetical protein
MRSVDISLAVEEHERRRCSGLQRIVMFRVSPASLGQELGHQPQIPGYIGTDVRGLSKTARTVGAMRAEIRGAGQRRHRRDSIASLQCFFGGELEERGHLIVGFD